MHSDTSQTQWKELKVFNCSCQQILDCKSPRSQCSE